MVKWVICFDFFDKYQGCSQIIELSIYLLTIKGALYITWNAMDLKTMKHTCFVFPMYKLYKEKIVEQWYQNEHSNGCVAVQAFFYFMLQGR